MKKTIGLQQKGHFSHPGPKGRSLSTTRSLSVLCLGSTVGTFKQNTGIMSTSVCKCAPEHPRTIHALLAQHGGLGVLGPQAGGVRGAELLRAGGAAAVLHLGLVHVRQEALVAVFI